MLAARNITPAHIWLDDQDQAWVDDTNTKVIEIALDAIAHGWSPEEIHFQHTHLSLSQIHSALAYYYDHLDAFTAQIEKGLLQAQQMRDATLSSPLRQRLQKSGSLA